VEEAEHLIASLKDPDININLDEVMDELLQKELRSSFSLSNRYELLRRESSVVTRAGVRAGSVRGFYPKTLVGFPSPPSPQPQPLVKYHPSNNHGHAARKSLRVGCNSNGCPNLRLSWCFGDLTQRKLVPASQIETERHIPQKPLLSAARREWSDDYFREQM